MPLLLFSSVVLGQHPERTTVSGFSVQLAGEEAEVRFELHLPPERPQREALVYAPQITDGEHTVSLTPVLVQPPRWQKAWQRHEWAAGQTGEHVEAIRAVNGQTVQYRAAVPFQHWMHGARIEAEVLTVACGEVYGRRETLARDILPAPVAEPEPDPIPEPQMPAKTLAEKLAETFSFVLPASEFDPDEPIKFYDDERDNSLTIYYRINKYDIEPSYADNLHTLTNLTAVVDLIRKSTDADVKRVVVAGFASPDGPAQFNDRLAWERAVSVKEYLMHHTDIPAELINLYNGSADWRGLRKLVAQDNRVPARQEVLRIIDGLPRWDTRTHNDGMARIKALEGGKTYRYLADQIFPKLRNGTFIRVYFETRE